MGTHQSPSLHLQCLEAAIFADPQLSPRSARPLQTFGDSFGFQVGSNEHSNAQWPGDKKGILCWLVEFKGEPFPKKRKKGFHSATGNSAYFADSMQTEPLLPMVEPKISQPRSQFQATLQGSHRIPRRTHSKPCTQPGDQIQNVATLNWVFPAGPILKRSMLVHYGLPGGLPFLLGNCPKAHLESYQTTGKSPLRLARNTASK